MDSTSLPDDAGVATALLRIQRERQKRPPFLRLPTEIIIHILYLLTRSQGQPLKRLHALSQICRRLREIIDETPSLWTIMSISDPIFLLTKAVATSEPYSFAFLIDERPVRFPERLYEEYASRLATIRSQCDRWYSADILLCEPIVSTEPPHIFSGIATPLLERLLVRSSGYYPTFEALPIRAPMLQSVTLDGITVAWDSAVLTDLRSLCLRNPLNKPTLTQIIDLLGRNLSLQDLELQFMPPRIPETVLPPPTDDGISIQLQRLRYIKLEDLTPDFIWALLPSLQAPSCTFFHLHIRHAEFRVQPQLRGALQQALNFLPPRSERSILRLRMFIRGRIRGVTLRGEGKRPLFEVQWQEDYTSIGHDWIRYHLIPQLHHPETSLWFEPLKYSLKAQLKIFLVGIGPHLSTLHFHCKERNPWLLEYLETPCDGTYPFPILAHLALGTQCNLLNLLRAMKVRYGLKEEAAAGLPVPLRTLDVGPKGSDTSRKWYGEIRADIAAVVGEGVLVSRS